MGSLHLLRLGALLLCTLHLVSAQTALPNCSYPAVYGFGDSLTDVGNAIAAFPEKFQHCEEDPYGVTFPMHAADRFTDGKMFVDFLAFGVRRRPTYAALRGTAGDFTYGTNFAASGGPARPVKVWNSDDKFSTPFSLEVQQQWFQRYKIRLWFYESPVYNPNGRLVQSLPKLANISASLYTVWAGYQDYFFSLYDKKLTVGQTLKIVPDVVKAIEEHIEKMLAVVEYTPPGSPSLLMPPAKEILIQNQLPLGCVPAMLTLYGGSKAKYDEYGCLSSLNKISEAHNTLLGKKVEALRKKYPDAKLYYGDVYAVYTDILKEPAKYNVTAPLKACCGVGGDYNFNKDVWCGYSGTVEGKFVNLTSTHCADPVSTLSWDGIHTSNTVNKALATAFLTGKHIYPEGGLKCNADFTFWEART
jgi:hypothetical protein